MALKSLEYRGNTRILEETKAGFSIYDGNASDFHMWEFKVKLKIQSCEDKREYKNIVRFIVEALRGDALERARDIGIETLLKYCLDSDAEETSTITEEAESGTQDSAEIVGISEEAQGTGKGKGSKSSIHAGESSQMPIRSTHTRRCGIDLLIEKIGQYNFPLKQDETKELHRAGMAKGGKLARQPGEAMQSYILRRDRWYKILTDMESDIKIRDDMLGLLLLENAGLSEIQKTMILTSTQNDTSFERVSSALTTQHSQIHASTQFGSKNSYESNYKKGKGKFGGKGVAGNYSGNYNKGKGKFRRSAHMAYDGDLVNNLMEHGRRMPYTQIF